mmetsp:Transcript_12001/g.20256  ORF Transcript_12001/g.20256 Transcript_12001/m.20256 type:complete len:111 (+) Transcript_12001:236-568(+)
MDKCSEFLYRSIDRVEAMAIRRENFNQVMNSPLGKKLKAQIAKRYKFQIQEQLFDHRNDTVLRFQNRIDYVNIEAYGVGRVALNTKMDNQLDFGNQDSHTSSLSVPTDIQ